MLQSLIFSIFCFVLAGSALGHDCYKEDVILYDFEKNFDVSKLKTEYVTAKVISIDGGKALSLELLSSEEMPMVTFNLPEKYQDLSSKRYVEMDIKNLADEKAVLTFWALSGAGWGGMNSAAETESGRETLDPNSITKLRIDLHGRYPGPDALATAIDPAKVKQLKIVFHLRQAGFQFEVDNIKATGRRPQDSLGTSARFPVPEVTTGRPAPGKRVRHQLASYKNTDVAHVLCLPKNWQPERRYPIIVEYTGNRFYHKYCHSTGLAEQGNLAYGLSRGEDFICINMPFISEDGRREQVDGWGSEEKTIDYCLEAIKYVCQNYGGDPGAVFITGFSRGDIACNYIALYNDEIADVWLGFIGNPGGKWTGGDGWKNSGIGWDERAKRVKGRSCFQQRPNLGPAHVDVQYLEGSRATIATRQWLKDVLKNRPGTHSGREVMLWYDEPADSWFEALPAGNGRLGAMVFGGVQEELIQLNEDSVWSGQPYYKETPEMLNHIPEVRRLIFEGKYAEAEALAQKTMTVKNDPRFGSYKPLGDLKIKFNGLENVQDYRRELNLDTAVVTTSFQAGEIKYVREVFSSFPDQVVVVYLYCEGRKKITCEVELTRQFRSQTKAHGSDELIMEGNCEYGGVKFAALLKAVNEGGAICTKDNKLRIDEADSVMILIAANTTYRHEDYADVCGSQIAKAAVKNYSAVRQDHIADHQRLFRRVALDLGKTDAAVLPTNERLRLFKEGAEDMADDLDLVALFFQYGRYLLIAGSRPGSLPANLQGLWNPLFEPPWFCDYHVNVNTQMNYWPAESCNLSELAEPLYDFIDRCRSYGSRAARERYGCSGIVLSSCTNVWAVSEQRSSLVGLWQEGAGWLCQQLWQHYEYSQDKQFLIERAYPRLKEAAEFYLDYLVEHPKYGWLVSGPTISPENMYLLPGADVDKVNLASRRGESGGKIPTDQKAAIAMGPTMATQIIKDVFSECIQAGEILGIDEDFRKELIEKKKRLAPMQIGKHGQLQEWLEDFDEANLGHRHVSHLYGLQPGNQITLRGTPELAAAARKSLERRLEYGGGWTGWSAAWLVNLWARLEDGDKAYESLQSQMRNCLFDNLFDNHWRAGGAVFQIDGNFGATNAVAEMLLGSHTGEIHLLPALPHAWKNGSVRGLRARGNYELEIQWADGELVQAVLHSKTGGKCRVRYHEKVIELDAQPFEDYVLTPDMFPGNEDADTRSDIKIGHEYKGDDCKGLLLKNAGYQVEVLSGAVLSVKNLKDGSAAEFNPEFAVWYNENNPRLMHGTKFKATVNRNGRQEEVINYQVPAWNNDPDFFHAPGDKYILYPTRVSAFERGIRLDFPEQEVFKLSAEVIVPEDNSRIKYLFHLEPRKKGYYSVGYLGVPERGIENCEWIWQPLIWQGKRFPLASYFTMEYRFPVPAVLMGFNGASAGIAADPAESPFRLPDRNNSRFGGLVRNAGGNAQPMLFAPVYGGAESQRDAGQVYEFSFRLVLERGDWYRTFRRLAYDLYQFGDSRQNGICTLNQTLDNMIDFVLTDKYSYWYPDMKTNGYQTDKAGWGRQQSAVSPLSLALVCDNEDLYYHRALPSIEYMASRKSSLIKLDGTIPFMNGAGANTAEWTALSLISGKRTPVFERFAREKADNKQPLTALKKDLGREESLTFAKRDLRTLIAMYRLTRDSAYLEASKNVADNYIRWRINQQPEDYLDVGSTFWQEFSPMYDILYELYQETGEKTYLDASIKCMEAFCGYVYLQPTIPDKNILVNLGGAFRGIPAPEEWVPAWRVSANGLASECGGTSHSHRGIFMAPYAAYMTKFAYYSDDPLFRDIARSAIVGRYANYPSYAYRHGHTTVNQSPGYPLRPFEELTWTSEHYNHPAPMCTYIVDYLAAEALYRSKGHISFPSRYTATGAFFMNQVYGDRPGEFYGEKGVWLWLPKSLLKTDSLQVNYIAGHGNGKLYLAFMNPSGEAVNTMVHINEDRVKLAKESDGKIYNEDSFGGNIKIKENSFPISIEPKGITALAIDKAQIMTSFQHKYIESDGRKLSENSYREVKTPFGKITAMAFSLSDSLSSIYVWLEVSPDDLKEASIVYQIRDKEYTVTDSNYPFEFTILMEDPVEKFVYSVEGRTLDDLLVKNEKMLLTLYE